MLTGLISGKDVVPTFCVTEPIVEVVSGILSVEVTFDVAVVKKVARGKSVVDVCRGM